MVNTNIQGVVPIEGRGFTAFKKWTYRPGEYKKLSNFLIQDGMLKTRNNVNHYLGDTVVAVPVTNSSPVLGFFKESFIVSSATEQFAYKFGTKSTLWAPNLLPTDGNAASFHRIVGAFEYNNLNYWLTWRFDFTTTTHTMRLYWAPVATALTAVTFASLTSTTLFTNTSADFSFKNFFIFKERLWVASNKGVACSKATDPGIFPVPDGFVVNFPGRTVNYIFPHKDSVFILADSAIYNFSYGVNPNTDGYMREVTNVMGADHGTSHGDGAYVVNSDGIFAISANSVELVRDDFEVGFTQTNFKLVSWEKYLILVKYSLHNVSATSSVRVRKEVSFGSAIDSTCWFINMQTGACHTLDFQDQFTNSGIGVYDRGNVVDLILNPNKDSGGNTYLTIMTTKCTVAGTNPSYSQFYMMDSNEAALFVYDTVVNDPADNIVRRMKPNIEVQFVGYTPDGNEYNMKKFRNLELMGNFSHSDFEIILSYDNQDFVDAKARDLISDLAGIEAAGTKHAPYPARLGLNQRARAVNILMRTKNRLVPLIAPSRTIYEKIEITDIRFLWTYTGRAPTHITQSAST